jgi:hypothetical protein
VLTIVASTANKKITSITPKAARLRFDVVGDGVSGSALKMSRSVAC